MRVKGIPKSAFLLTATLVVGCVSLDKPKDVQKCAAAHNCSNNPIPQPGADANQDTGQPGPDLPHADRTAAKEDLGPDSPITDAPADQANIGRDTEDDIGTPEKDTGISPDADSGLPPADSKAELGSDMIQQDVALDLEPDLKPDLGPDLRPDLGPDLGPDTSPDTSTLLSGLLAYYKCESTTGTTLQDSSGSGNNGTLVGGTSGYSFPAGKVGTALALAKAGQGYVSLPPAVFANATDITIAAWVNVTTSQGWQRVFDTGINAKLATDAPTGTSYMNLVPKNSGTNLAFAISTNGYSNEQVLTSAALPTGTWKHVAVVLGSGRESLYVDGAVASTSSAISLRPKDLGAIDYAYLGKSQFTADPYFDGLIDEFRVYGRAVSAAEIQALYQFTGP